MILICSTIAGDWHTVGLCSDNTVISTRPDPSKYFAPDNFSISFVGTCDVEEWTDIIAIAAGTGYKIGLKKDGTVVTAGYNVDNDGDVRDGGA